MRIFLGSKNLLLYFTKTKKKIMWISYAEPKEKRDKVDVEKNKKKKMKRP